MKNKEFDRILNARIAAIRSTLQSKGVEYATDTDRLHNFKRAMVDYADKGVSHPVERWDEKLGDAINYLILLEAVVKEQR